MSNSTDALPLAAGTVLAVVRKDLYAKQKKVPSKLSRCWSQPLRVTPNSLSPTACSLMRT